MGFARKIARRAAAIGIAISMLSGFSAAGHPAHAGASAPNLQEALVAWRDSLRTWSTFSETRRHERSKEFMRRFDASDIAVICRECAQDTRLGVDGAAFLRARFALLPPGAGELASMFRDVTLGMPCHGTAIQAVFRNRDAFTAEEGDNLGEAMLALADRAAYGDELRGQLEKASAYLSSADRVLEGIRSRIDSADPKEREAGIAMAGESRDPRVTGLLSDLIDRFQAGAEFPPTRLLNAYATRSGRAGYDRIHRFYERSGDADFKLRALEAVCSTADPRAMRDLLEAYGDATTGIRDSTAQVANRTEKNRYQRLWSYTRILEPTLVESLDGGDPLLRTTALELADRESRFGPPVEPGELMRALRAFASSPGQSVESSRRAMATLSRVELRVQEWLRARPGKQ